MTQFTQEEFRNPASSHWPGYFWFINSHLDADEIKRQLQEMYDRGAKSVCFHPLPAGFRYDFYSTLQSYLSEEYHQCVEIAVEECQRLGMNYYLYDEGGWPSGSACGLVWQSNPEKYCLQFMLPDGENGAKLQKMTTAPQDCFAFASSVAPGAMEKFLELTHESYAKHIGRYFGNTIRFAFTDEPFPPSVRPNEIGWCDDFDGEFRKRKGYDISPWLTRLFNCENEQGGRDNPVIRVKVDYSEVMAALFEERYILPLRQWCRDHNLLSGGHFSGEDDWANVNNLCGHLLHSLRGLDFPGVDVIWRQLHPDKPWHPFPKLASSAANQNGHTEIMAEMFAVYGAGLKPEEMKAILNFMLLCGVNTFVFANIPYSLQGRRMSVYRPHFGPHHPLWKYFDIIHGYTARMSYLMTCGKPVRDTGVFFDMRSFWAGGNTAIDAQNHLVKISNDLWNHQCDFDYLDEEVLLHGETQNGKLCYGDAQYSNIIIPADSWLSPAAEKRITELEIAGIRILTSAAIPTIASLATVSPANAAIHVAKRTLGNGKNGYYFFNNSKNAVDVELQLPENSPVAWADCESGCLRKISACNGKWNWHFEPWCAAYFVSGEEGSAMMPPHPGDCIQLLQEGWQLRPVRRHFMGKDNYLEEDLQESAKSVSLGNWQQYLGEEFSGDALYSIDFENTGKGRFLDLGAVNYACSVCLNGIALGHKLWSPFVFDLKDALRPGVNHLEITVSNTSANLFTDEKRTYIRETFPPESPYDARQGVLEKLSVASGLLGPVRILN